MQTNSFFRNFIKVYRLFEAQDLFLLGSILVPLWFRPGIFPNIFRSCFEEIRKTFLRFFLELLANWCGNGIFTRCGLLVWYQAGTAIGSGLVIAIRSSEVF